MSEPEAWLVTGGGYQYVSLLMESAESEAAAEGGSLVPLYRSPTLTDDERLAIQWVIGEALSVDGVSIQATLRGLLERCATAGREGIQ